MTVGRERVSFGIKTPQAYTNYDEVLRVWEEADGIPEIEHAWLWDRLYPPFGKTNAPVLESWTLLAALAARTERLGLGILVSSNRKRPPALLAKMAATVDAVAHGRLTVGIGVGGTRTAEPEPATAEYRAYGLQLPTAAEGIARLDEACVVLRRLWTEEVFDFSGRYYPLTTAPSSPRPERRPPLLIGAAGPRALRVVAQHADIWNISGPPHNDVSVIRDRMRVLDEHCAAIGRDPAEITRSVQTHVSYPDPASTRALVLELIDAGVTHIVLSLKTPFPEAVARWTTDEIINPVREHLATTAGAV
ncbi:LLM class flavin-dependent oxidoreductase [Streptomyces specialis]|uniref:LLM class flavin-dependent oxidoreductase n=1 Tax=Streptomyces specialis TaxID=498367 RepID=UPI00073F95C5|nr:LLM class flavin-dependent oxidoreductase [Streptomyces specialis]